MSIFDRFKKKEEKRSKPVAKSQEPKKAGLSKKEKKPKPTKPKKAAKTRKVSKKEENLAFELLLKPLISEKATAMGQFGKYVFKVNPRAGKHADQVSRGRLLRSWGDESEYNQDSSQEKNPWPNSRM